MPSIRETTLDNGLKVLVQEVHTAPLASVWCWYRVGSRDEAAGLTGVSHWVEHMNFKGTENIPRDQVKGIIEQYGGSWNGYTWIDQTTYLETATRDALDRMLFIEAERMDKCLYDPGDCESERTVIISELQGGENDPEQLLEQCRETLQAGYPIIVFPEGTRSRPGQALQFQRGAAHIAVRCEADIVPLVISCEPPMLRKGEPWYRIPPRRAHIVVSAGERLSVPELTRTAPSQAAATRRLNRFLQDYYQGVCGNA